VSVQSPSGPGSPQRTVPSHSVPHNSSPPCAASLPDSLSESQLSTNTLRLPTPTPPSDPHGTASSASTIHPPTETLSPQDIVEGKRELILDLTLEVAGQCPICFFHRTTCQPHWAFRCDSGLCGTAPRWKSFKTFLRLGSSVCWRCALPFGSPYNHPPPPSQCDYPDLLKELAFLVYVDDHNVRDAVFAVLGSTPPATLARYGHWLGQTGSTPGATVNIVEVLAVYWSLRTNGTLP
jgi:hypothetical protein